jgi:polyisoprenoid-binding protein YceI
MSTTESLTATPVATWQLDPVHSTVGFEVAYLGGAFRGQFRAADAELTLRAGTASLTGSAEVASVDVKDENLSAHLQSPEFFDAERHPELRFAADGVTVDGSTLRGEGEITIKGVTKPVEIEGTLTGPITDGYGKERIGVRVSATVDRTAFGVSWNTPLPSGEQALSDDVTIDDVTIDADLFFVAKA